MKVAINRENKMNVSSLVRDGVSLTSFATRIIVKINPFAPEPPVTARADPGPFYPSLVLMVKDNFLR